LRESLVTLDYITNVRLLPVVNSLMLLETRILGKCFEANSAVLSICLLPLMRSFSRMKPRMLAQSLLAAEELATSFKIAYKGLLFNWERWIVAVKI